MAIAPKRLVLHGRTDELRLAASPACRMRAHELRADASQRGRPAGAAPLRRHRRTGCASRAGRDGARHQRPRDHARDAHRPPPRIDGVLDEAIYRDARADHRLRAAGARRRPARHRADAGLDPRSTRPPLHRARAAATASPRGSSPTTCAATGATSARTTTSASSSTRSTIAATATSSWSTRSAACGTAQITDERDINRDWNTIWDVAQPRVTSEGWTVEMAIPFRSLRYRGGGPQVWGINIRRNVRWKNELSYLSPVPRRTARAASCGCRRRRRSSASRCRRRR